MSRVDPHRAMSRHANQHGAAAGALLVWAMLGVYLLADAVGAALALLVITLVMGAALYIMVRHVVLVHATLRNRMRALEQQVDVLTSENERDTAGTASEGTEQTRHER